MNFDSYVNEQGHAVYQDKNLQVINYSRAKLISLEEACIELNYHEGIVDIDFTYQVEKDLETQLKDSNEVNFFKFVVSQLFTIRKDSSFY